MEIPANVTTIAFSAFYNMTFQESTIPDFITKVTFAKESNLTLLNRSCFDESHFTSIDFSNCNSLNSLVNPCFSMSFLTSIKFPKNLKEIGDFIFSRCTNLVSLNLQECTNLTAITIGTFSYCTSLTSIIFPSSLNSIGQDAFQNTPQLSKII